MAPTIVQSVASEPPITVPTGSSVRDAAQRMRDQEVGSILILEDERLVGIVTERDLTGRILAEGLDPDQTAVDAIMSSPVVTVEPATKVEDAIERMIDHEVKRLVVELDGELRGVVSVTDVAYAAPELARRVTDYMRTRWEG